MYDFQLNFFIIIQNKTSTKKYKPLESDLINNIDHCIPRAYAILSNLLSSQYAVNGYK